MNDRKKQVTMRERIFTVSLYAVGISASLAMSYGFALLEEPRSYWLWHSMLGVLN